MSNTSKSLQRFSDTLKSYNLHATGGAVDLAYAVTYMDRSKRWSQRYGMPGIWAQMLAHYPLRAKLVAVTLAELGITVDQETRMSEVLSAAQTRGLVECSYGTIPLLLSSNIRLASTGSSIGDAYRRVVVCTPQIGDTHKLFAFRNESNGRLCASYCLGYPSIRIIEMFSDEGLCFTTALPKDNPQRDVAFLFATLNQKYPTVESKDCASIPYNEDATARSLIKCAARFALDLESHKQSVDASAQPIWLPEFAVYP